MKQIITSLDIGSDKIKLIVSEVVNGNPFVLACSETISKGIKKGIVVDEEKATNCIKECFRKVNDVLGTKIDNVILVVPSYNTEFIKSSGNIKIDREDNRVNSNDIIKAMQMCVYNKVPANKELINIMPVQYIVDENLVDDPKGINAGLLTINSLLSVCPKKNLVSILSILDSLGITVSDLCLGGLADYYAFINKRFKNKEVGIINIGKYKTEVSVLYNGILENTLTIDLGGKNIDRDISYIYDITLKESNKLKEHFAVANLKYASTSENIELVNKNNDKILVNQYELSEIVYKRIVGILELAKKQINVLTNKEISYIIVTGGTTEIDYFESTMEELINKSILGKINEMGIRNAKFSSVYGITKYYTDKINFRNKLATTMNEEQQEELFQEKKKFNSNILAKIYGYFFDN